MQSCGKVIPRRGVNVRYSLSVFPALLLISCGDSAPGTNPDGKDAAVDLAGDPGRVTIHRLNRAEYDNTVRDLFLTSQTPAEDFPFDDFGYGFDNIADVLSISPLHVELYELAADSLLDELFAASHPVAPTTTRFEGESDLTTTTGGSSGSAWNLWSVGTASTDVELVSGGHYRIHAKLWANQAGPDLASASFMIDGLPVSTFDVSETGSPGGTYTYDVDFAYGGTHTIGIRFENDYYQDGQDRNLYVDYLEIEGPTDQYAEAPTGWARIFTCDPDSVGFVEDDCAEEVLTGFGRDAWRRPLTTDEIDGLVALYRLSRDSGGDWYEGVALGMKAALMSPYFVYRVELSADPASSEPRALNAYEVASRLSYFLWSSMPDAALFAKAEDGTLLQPEVLAAEVDRMLADAKAAAIVDNLGGQWLYIRAVDDAFPDYAAFPEWNEDLRASMKEEMRRDVSDLFLQDRSVLDLFTREETWVDARLADYYGLPAPVNGDWGLVSLADDTRAGLLTTGGLLTALSYPTRTSPVRRGKWILGNLMCEAPAPPPADVDTNFVEEGDSGAAVSLREQFEQHRADPVCASCHTTMDPIGFSMENFDAIGAWRDLDEIDEPIDATGSLPDGTSFVDIGDLATQLAQDPKVPICIVQKTFTYALGRAPGVEDLRYLEQIEGDFIGSDYRFSALARAIALSEPFLFEAGEPAAQEQ